jgi:hypothetical protein
MGWPGMALPGMRWNTYGLSWAWGALGMVWAGLGVGWVCSGPCTILSVHWLVIGWDVLCIVFAFHGLVWARAGLAGHILFWPWVGLDLGIRWALSGLGWAWTGLVMCWGAYGLGWAWVALTMGLTDHELGWLCSGLFWTRAVLGMVRSVHGMFWASAGVAVHELAWALCALGTGLAGLGLGI